MKASESNFKDTKLVFLQKGTCSQTLFYILNQYFGNELVLEERAADSLAGGIVKQGQICGLLLGAILAIGVESYHEGNNTNHSICLAVDTTKKLLESFEKRTNEVNCLNITNVDFTKKGSIAKSIFSGTAIKCFKLADNWAPEAIEIGKDALLQKKEKANKICRSCATRVIREMGGSETEAIMVAGLAGGVGLSGKTCGALTASVWFKALRWLRNHPEKKHYPIPLAKEQLARFLKITNEEYLCPNLSGRTFKSIDEHSEFIDEGGCNKLINILAKG